VLAVVAKSKAAAWLERFGELEEKKAEEHGERKR
jgi:hypothetical protein